MVAASTGKKPQVAPYSGAMLPMVALSATERKSRPGPKNSTNLPTTPCLRSICVTVSTRSVAVTPSFNCPLSLKPTTSGSSIDSGWPSMAASASMPPTPQPSTARPLTIVVAIGADEGIGIGDGLAAFGLGPDGLRQVFEVYLVADTRARGDNAEIVEGRLAPAQEFVTLAIALVFAVDVLGKGGGGAEIVDHYGMVDDEVDRHQRIDLLRIGLELFGRIAHGGEVDNGGDAGKVLHQHAGGAEGDLVLGLAFVLEPGGDRLDIVRIDAAAVLEAQQVFQHYLEGLGQPGNVGEPVLFGLRQGEVGVGLAAHRKGRLGFEAVGSVCHGNRLSNRVVAPCRWWPERPRGRRRV